MKLSPNSTPSNSSISTNSLNNKPGVVKTSPFRAKKSKVMYFINNPNFYESYSIIIKKNHISFNSLEAFNMVIKKDDYSNLILLMHSKSSLNSYSIDAAMLNTLQEKKEPVAITLLLWGTDPKIQNQIKIKYAHLLQRAIYKKNHILVFLLLLKIYEKKDSLKEKYIKDILNNNSNTEDSLCKSLIDSFEKSTKNSINKKKLNLYDLGIEVTKKITSSPCIKKLYEHFYTSKPVEIESNEMLLDSNSIKKTINIFLEETIKPCLTELKEIISNQERILSSSKSPNIDSLLNCKMKDLHLSNSRSTIQDVHRFTSPELGNRQNFDSLITTRQLFIGSMHILNPKCQYP